ncbi:MAG: tetratricopeptide repeat protein [Polyangiales bacterium]
MTNADENLENTTTTTLPEDDARPTQRPAPDLARIQELDEAVARFEGQKRWQDVIRSLVAKAELLVEPAERVAVYERVAGLYVERFSNLAEAIKANETILEIDPENAGANSFLRATYEKRKDWDKLLRLLRADAEAAPVGEQLDRWSEIARFVSEKVKRVEASVEAWEQVLARAPEHTEAISQLSGLYEKSRDYEKLAGVLRVQATQTGEPAARVQILVKLGMIASDRLNNDELAVEAWRGVLALEPNDRRAQEALKKRLLAMSAWDELEAFYAESEKWDELIRLLEREAESESLDAAVRVTLLLKVATLWEDRKEKPERAARYLEKVLELDPGHRGAALRLVPIYESARDDRRLAAALEVKLPGDAPGEERLGSLRRLGGLYEGSLKDPEHAFVRFLAAFDEDPGEPRSIEDLERVSDGAERWETVVEHVGRALAGAPGAPWELELRLRQGEILAERVGRPDAAVEAFRAVLEIDPGELRALDALDGLHRRGEQWSDLLSVLERRLALTEEPGARRALLLEAASIAETKVSDQGRAIEFARAMVAEGGDDLEVLAILDRLYQAVGNHGALADVIQRELDLSADVDVEAASALKFRLATIRQEHMGDVPGAVRLLREILSESLEHGGARASLEQLLRDPEWRAEAARILQPVYEHGGDWEALVRALEILVVDEDDVAERVTLLRRIGVVHAQGLGDARRAMEAFGRAFRENPTDLEVVEELVEVAGSIDAWAEVVALLREAAIRYAGDPVARVLLLRVAEIESTRLGNVSAAVEALERMLEADPVDDEALRVLERTYRAAARWPDVLATLRRRLDHAQDPDAYDAILVEVARVHDEQLGDTAMAVTTYREMLARDPASRRALEALDRLYTRQGDWSELAENLELRLTLVDAAEEQTALQLRLAEVRDQRLADRAGAIEIYRQILDRDPESEAAVTALDGMITERAYTAGIVEVLEPVFRAQGSFDRLVNALEVQARFTDDVVAHVDLLHRIAEIQEVALDDAGTAFQTLARALEADPSREDTLNALDRIALSTGASQAFLGVLKGRIAACEDPAVKVLLHRRAAFVAEERLEQVDEAIEQLNAVVALDPGHLDALSDLERLYQLTDRGRELAATLVKKSEVVESIDDRKAHLWRAAELYETTLDDTPAAIETYKRIVAVDDGEVQALDALIRLYIGGSMWSELLGAYEKKADVVSDPEEKKRLFFGMASVYESELDDGAKAVDAYNRALELDPTDLVAIQRLDQLYTAQGRWQELLSVLEREAELSSDPAEIAAHRFRVGEIYDHKIDSVERAVDIYREILDVVPDHEPSIAALTAILRGDRAPLLAAAVLEPHFSAAGEFARVVEVHEVEIARCEDPLRKIELLRRVAEIQSSALGDGEAAFDAMARAVRADPRGEDDLGLFEQFGESLGAWDRVARTYDEALPSLAEDPVQQVELLLRTGQIYEVQVGDAETAVARYAAVATLDPENGPALRSLDRLYESLERWDLMAETLAKEVALADVSPDELTALRFRLAQVRGEKLGDIDGALAAYREILDTQSDHEPSIAALEQLFANNVRRVEIAAILEPIYRLGEDWQRLADLQAQLLELVVAPAERIALIRQIAETFEDKLVDGVTAFSWMGRAVREAPLDELCVVDAERLAALTSQWAELTNVYADVVEAEDSSDEVKVVIGKRLARVHEEELGDLASAEGAYAFVAEVSTYDADALDALDRLYTASGDAERLAEVLARRVDSVEDAYLKTEFTFRLAQILQLSLERVDDAVLRYRAIVDHLDPQHRPSLDALEAIYLQSERWAELYENGRRKLEGVTDPEEQADIHTQMAQVAQHYLGRPDEAVQLYEQVLSLRGEEPETLGAIASLHEEAGRWPQLIEVLERQFAAENDPDLRVQVALRIAAVIHYRLGDVERAIDGYRRVLDIDTANFDAMRALAGIYRAAQNWDELVLTLQSLLQVGSGTLEAAELREAWAELGRIFWSVQQQGFESAEAWRQVLDLDPADSEAIEALLVIHSAQGEWPDVVEVLQRKAGLQPDEASKVAVLLQIADVWEQRIEDGEGARAAYEQVLELDPLHERAFLALEALHTQASRGDDLATLYVNRHDQLADAGDTASAVGFMVKAANAYDELVGDREQAFAAAQIAFQEDVENPDAVRSLERLAAATQKWNELLQETLASYNSEPAGPRKTQLGLHVARWYGIELGHPEWAIPIYNQILGAEPDNLHALRALAELYRKLGQWTQLAKILERCVSAARTPEDRRDAHLSLGEVHEQHLDALHDAAAQYNAALSIDPVSLEAMDALGRVYEARGAWDELVGVLRRSIEVVGDPTQAHAQRLRVASILEDRLRDYPAAISEYLGVLETDVTNLDALRGLERLYAETGNSPELLRVLELQLDIASTEREQIKILTRLAEMLEEEFVKPDLAIQRFEQVLDIDPANDPALRGLERLYRNTSRWSELVETYEKHLVAIPDRRDRAPIFLAQGRVYIDELRDMERAEDSFVNALQIDPANVVAMEALTKIYEGRGEWDRALDVMEQLAAIYADDLARSLDLRHRIGRLAEEHLQDEARAMEQYQAALDASPTYLPALTALRGIFTRREDWWEVAAVLDREQAATEQPRQRARLLAELGRVNATYLDEPPRAIGAYEEALRNDPELEEAAWPLCMYLVSEGRYEEAEPLSELLVRRASRRDPSEQLEIQITMGRIAAALQKHDRAIKAFSAAHTLDRANVEVISALAVAHYEKRDWEGAFKHYQLLLVHHKDELGADARADLYHRLGVVKREQGDHRRAVNFLEKALEEYPGYRPALDALVSTYEAAGEWDQVIAYKEQLLELEDDEEVRYRAFIEIGGLWQEKARNAQKAIQSYAAATEIKPQDHVTLHKLLALYQETRQWSKLIDVIARIADLESDPVRKARYAYTIATIYNSEIKDSESALEHYNKALDLNPSELKPFAKINEVLTGRRDFKELERNFRKMLHRVAGKGDRDLEFNLLHNLGIIYRDRLGQPEAAIKAFDMAVERKPDDLTERKILAELNARNNRVDDAITHWRAILEQDLGNAEAITAVFDLYYQSRQYDKAWCVAAACAFLLRDKVREDLRAFYEQYKPRRPVQPTGRLTEENWVKQLFHPNEDPVVGKIYASIVGPLRNAKVQPLARFGFTAAELHNPATSSVALVKSMGTVASALNLPLPQVFVRPQQPGGLGYVPSDPIASVAGQSLLSGLRPEELSFVAAKHMSYYRNEHYVRVLFPTVQELTAILLAAIKLVKPDQDVPPEALQTAQQLAPLVGGDPVASEGLRKVVRVFFDQGGASNIKRWYQSVELTAARAGFLVCGDHEVARKMIHMEPGLPGDLSPNEKLKDVILFSISENYFALREALGINFQSAAGY